MNIPKVVIIKTFKGQKYANFIAKEINLKGYCCGITDIKNIKNYLRKWHCSPNTTIIHSRTAHPNYIYKILKQIENQGYIVVNSAEAIKLTSDKYNSCIFAEDKDILCAKTIKVSKEKSVAFVNEKIKDWGDIVVKPVTSQGQGKFCFKFNKSNIDQIEKINDIPAKELVVQRFLDYQRLNRVIVIGETALKNAVFWDKPIEKGWKCSVCLNSGMKVYKNPPKELLGFAEKIARLFKAEISFIDIFTTPKGYFLSEINTACSLVIHERVSRYNISKEIANYLLSKI